MSLSQFVILSKIGEGAYSSVHKVKRISDGNIYALKKVKIVGLKEKEKQNALNQVRLLASIACDFIIKYKEAFFDSKSNTLCIIIEYADGGDLEKLIEKKKKSLAWVEEKEIWTMIKQVTAGLQVLHERNIIHRDIKCANIFISNGVYKIADLNVSKLMKKNLAYTQTGTPYYASPQVWQDKPYELKSDIWSLGCIIYELCSLKPPFTSNSMEGLYKKVMKGTYPRIPSSYSQKLSHLINLCLQLDPNKRPTCKQLLKLIPETDQKSDYTTMSTINLLNTIKIPKNQLNWKDELPKADYDNLSEKSVESQRQSKPNKFGYISQQKLRQIVKSKNQEVSNKKEIVKRINPESLGTHKLIQAMDLRQKKDKVDLLPRLKLHSEPADRVRVNDLLSRLKEEEKKRYDYNRPSWWG